MEARLVPILAGRAAEEIIFDDVTAGAVSDLQRASDIARAMVRQYGMSDLGPVWYTKRNDLVFLGREIAEGRNYSDKVAEQIDGEVNKIVTRAYERAKKLLADNKEKLVAVAKGLLERETLDTGEVKSLMGGHVLAPVLAPV